MQKFIYSNKRGILAFLLLFSTTAVNFNLQAQTAATADNPAIFHIQNYFSEAYLIQGSGDKLILVETGVPVAGYQDSLVQSIRKLGFRPEQISLAIVTHGHGDHAGNARFLQETFHIPIAGSKADLDKFTSGKTDLSKSEDVSIWGNRLRPYSDLSYAPFTPDVLVDNQPVDLAKYGVIGQIIPIKGGHTPGDLLILVGKNLFAGDAFVGTFKAQGGGLAPDGHHAREHFFHENKQLAGENLRVIEKIALDHGVTMLYPTHNGPVSTDELRKYIREEALLKLLSAQETAMQQDIVQGKSTLHNTYLSDNFVLKTVTGKEYTKKQFIEAYIMHPEDEKISLSAEDFRIVYANEHIAVLTYLEITQSKGKDPQTRLVTGTYAKAKNGWKLVYRQTANSY